MTQKLFNKLHIIRTMDTEYKIIPFTEPLNIKNDTKTIQQIAHYHMTLSHDILTWIWGHEHLKYKIHFLDI